MFNSRTHTRERSKPDFWQLSKIPGYFHSLNDAAAWLQANQDDPYWMAHALNHAASPIDYSCFAEYWKIARKICAGIPMLN